MRIILACLATVLVSTGAMAQSKPLQVSLTPDLALFDRTETIEGLTLSVWGENHQRALGLGIVNGSVGKSAGVSWGFVLNYAEHYTGVHWALANYAGQDFLGWQNSFVNYTDGSMKGLQTGWVNYAGHLTGVQFGFVNYADTAENGVQIGILNVIRQNTSWFGELPGKVAPATILINWRF